MIPQLEMDTDDPLDTVRSELASLYKNEQMHATDLPSALRQIEAVYAPHLGHRAEFWLLLGVGYRIVTPYPIYGSQSSHYYGHADSCTDLDTATYQSLRQTYDEFLIEQFEARAERSPALISTERAMNYRRAVIRLRFAREKHTVTV